MNIQNILSLFKLKKKEQESKPYQAVCLKVEQVFSIPGADNIVAASILNGSATVIVKKGTKIGDVGLYFCPGIQLSKEFVKENNLSRDKTLNKDPEKVGYIESNRRIKPLMLRGVFSDGLFLPIDCLNYVLDKHSASKQEKIKDSLVGTSFFDFDGHKICSRYYTPRKVFVPRTKPKSKIKRFKLFLSKVKEFLYSWQQEFGSFERHKNTLFFRTNYSQIKKTIEDSLGVGLVNSVRVTVTPKLHGTSARYGIVNCGEKLSLFGGLITKEDFQAKQLGGTRNVVFEDWLSLPDFRKKFCSELLQAMDIHDPETLLQKDVVVYGEIVGYEDQDKTIMFSQSFEKVSDKNLRSRLVEKYGPICNYTYNCSPGESQFYVYRVVVDGVELSPEKVSDFVSLVGHPDIKSIYTYELGSTNTNLEKLEMAISLGEAGAVDPETLSVDFFDFTHIREGVIVRVDTPKGTTFYKEKSFLFKLLESYYSIPENEEDEDQPEEPDVSGGEEGSST